VEEYLFDAGEWDGRDRIRELADRVPCRHPHWRNLFYRWFLSMVAHWLGRDKQHGNATTPILIGAQGYRKSTFCRILLPPELRFGYTDSLDFSSKRDAERYLGRFFLINLDEFDQISINQQGFLKHLLQKPSASLRKPYGTSILEMRRYASFIATSNHKDLLTDLSGNRRFICVEVTAPIDTNVTINYQQLYAQAVYAVMHGERYWLDDTDEALLKESNEEFRQVSPMEQLFLCHFILTTPEKGDGEWMMVMEIFNYLQGKIKEKLLIKNTTHLGRLLQKMEIPHKRVEKGSAYYLKKR
jgi:predicted P-loop ATPase